jgi:acetyl-CoA carboxylase beta subunit
MQEGAYLVYLLHPTTGGVLASWGSLGQITIGQPQALVGFLGPAVYLSLHGNRSPKGCGLPKTCTATACSMPSSPRRNWPRSSAMRWI